MVLNHAGLLLIFITGALALLSPCGFPMLPGFISYYLGGKASLEKAFSGGVLCTTGLLIVFSAIGVAVSTFGGLVSRYIPILELLAGIIVILMGISIIAEIRLPIFFTVSRAPIQRGYIGFFLYGVVYGLAILGCSAPVFFSILFYSIAMGGPLYGVVSFVVYASGMSLPIIITTILVVKAKKFILERIIKITPWFQKINGIVLIIIGVYLILFYVSFYMS